MPNLQKVSAAVLNVNVYYVYLCNDRGGLDDSAIASHTGDWSPITSRNHRPNLRKQVVIAKLGKRCGCHGSSEIVIYEYIFI